MSSSVKNNVKSRPLRLPLRWAIFIITAVIFLGWLAFDLSGFGGNIKFYNKWIECGQKPVETNPDFMYRSVPYYGMGPTFSLIRLSPEYFCTPLEAEQAGYSASPHQYEFPHLKAQDKN